MNYSGRGMIGRYCAAIAGPWNECMTVLAQLQWMIADMMAQEVAADPGCLQDLRYLTPVIFQDIMSFKTDNLGHDVVLYWENFPYKE
jgi:hypothetical protein